MYKKDDNVRPLIEILEDERELTQKLESVYRYMIKTDDTDLLDVLYARKNRLERDLVKTHGELKTYITLIFKQD